MRIYSVVRIGSEHVQVKVCMCVADWSQAKRKGELGRLYGIDISNAVYHMTGVKAYHPTVDDSARASNKLKFITLTYQDSEWAPAPDNVIQVDFKANSAPSALTNETDNLIVIDFVARRKAA